MPQGRRGPPLLPPTRRGAPRTAAELRHRDKRRSSILNSIVAERLARMKYWIDVILGTSVGLEQF
jgi:hypothetical protein